MPACSDVSSERQAFEVDNTYMPLKSDNIIVSAGFRNAPNENQYKLEGLTPVKV